MHLYFILHTNKDNNVLRSSFLLFIIAFIYFSLKYLGSYHLYECGIFIFHRILYFESKFNIFENNHKIYNHKNCNILQSTFKGKKKILLYHFQLKKYQNHYSLSNNILIQFTPKKF